MNAIQEIFRRHGDAYLAAFGARVSENQRRVIRAVQECRQGGCGHHLYACSCGQTHIAKSSCGNRHCPGCQHHNAARWVHRQQVRGLPCTYFFVTFTLPSELHPVARRHPREVYSALFDAAAESLKTLQADPRFIGSAVSGFFGVLHTWGRQMQYHPHVHFVVAGGGLDPSRSRWLPSSPRFLVHVKALSKMFRARLRERLRKQGLLEATPSGVWSRTDWVVHAKAVGDGRHVLKYLGAYIFRVAISSNRILEVSETNVVIAYSKVGSHRPRRMTLGVFEFIRRFLEHVLPSGFMKIRHYGFLSPNFSLPLERIRELICALYSLRELLPPPAPPPTFKPLQCPGCKGLMRWVRFFPPTRAGAPP